MIYVSSYSMNVIEPHELTRKHISCVSISDFTKFLKFSVNLGSHIERISFFFLQKI